MNEGTRPIYSVSELVQSARALLESKFSSVLVQGEIGRFTKHPSGHMYFDLKDEKCLVSCAFFKNANQALAFQPEQGMKVIVGGTLTLYEARGQFQLSVRSMEPQGVGGLQLAFEQLKRKLMVEGLFDEGRKKPVPEYPRHIALITSPSGAAIQDFMKILETRVGIESVDLFPVKVQGEGSAYEITEAIEEVSALGQHDVLVVTRGGGSLEDLAAFNDEGVVRALAVCSVPTISAIGHEVDFTLCDFVADRREPTPTAAAAHLAPGRDEVQQQLDHYEHRLKEALQNHIGDRKSDLQQLLKTLRDRRPDLLLDQARQDLDYRTQDLKDALETLFKDQSIRLVRSTELLSRFTPIHQLRPYQEKLRGLEAQLQAYHPHGPLKRGYAIVTQKGTGAILRSPKGLKKGDELLIQLQKGTVESEVVSTHEDE
jgi:exodeoxyribonuclease VII large subunit